MIREGISEELILERGDLDKMKVQTLHIWGKHLPGRGDCKNKGLEQRACLHVQQLQKWPVWLDHRKGGKPGSLEPDCVRASETLVRTEAAVSV